MLKTKHHGKFEKVVKWQRNPPTKSNQTIEIEDLKKTWGYGIFCQQHQK